MRVNFEKAKTKLREHAGQWCPSIDLSLVWKANRSHFGVDRGCNFVSISFQNYLFAQFSIGNFRKLFTDKIEFLSNFYLAKYSAKREKKLSLVIISGQKLEK